MAARFDIRDSSNIGDNVISKWKYNKAGRTRHQFISLSYVREHIEGGLNSLLANFIEAKMDSDISDW
jgi:hypothetical protein